MSFGSGILFGIGIDTHPIMTAASIASRTINPVTFNLVRYVRSDGGFNFKDPSPDLYYFAVYKGLREAFTGAL